MRHPKRRRQRGRVVDGARVEFGDEASSNAQALHVGVGEVTLHPEPRAVEATIPSLRSWVTVPLNNHNALPALINGRPCVLYVDCGTTSAMIAHHLADKLGLLQKVSYIKNYELQLWTTKVRHNLKVVENVQVELTGGVALSCTFLVLPEDMVSTLPGILLDNWTLRQAGAIQEFSSSSCVLYFPSRRPRGQVKKAGDSQYVLDVALKRKFQRTRKLNMHVDTGASSFYVSPLCLHARLGLLREPPSVSLVLGKGIMVTSGPVRTAGTDTFDFVVGKEMLSRYRSMLDFASNFLYFRVGERVFRVKLRKSSTV